MKRQFLLQALAGVALTACAIPSFAQATVGNWPDKPVKWVVPFPPGGAMDAIARTLGEVAGRKLGQPFVIENKPGAGGNIGSDYVAKQPADGYTLMITSIGMATNGALYNKLSYDPIKDFAPVSLLAVVPNILVAGTKQADVKSVQDLIAKAKQQPDALTYASAGNGTSIHLAGANFTALTGVKMLHVPYRGSGPAVTDLLGGQVDFMFDSITSARPHIQAGKLRAIAVGSPQRVAMLPDTPTIAEQGIKGYDAVSWGGLLAPKGTPQPVVERIASEVKQILAEPEIQSRLLNAGAIAHFQSPAEMGQRIQQDYTRWGQLIRDKRIASE